MTYGQNSAILGVRNKQTRPIMRYAYQVAYSNKQRISLVTAKCVFWYKSWTDFLLHVLV